MGVAVPQVLKDEIRERLIVAAEEVFYNKGFMNARLADIACEAEVSTSLVYSYFKNKEDLFAATVQMIPLDFDKIALEEERITEGTALDRYKKVAAPYVQWLLDNHRAFVIVMDKSHGTDYVDSKLKMISSVEKHIDRSFQQRRGDVYPDLLPHVLASNFVEGLLEVARHYESPEQARQLLELIVRCYYEGVNSL
ncbi:MAG: TetR/AcrR family transcriptional regulator [Actinomycetaceae bacterium]|nr:TetR/AcrR family transcriptional regulator [Actinomycetaceae bacterium]